MNQSADFAGLCAAVAPVLVRDYARSGTLTPLVGDVDDNLCLEADGCRFVVKLLPPTATAATLTPVLAALQTAAEQAPQVPVPRLVRTTAGADHTVVPTAAGPRLLWVSTWLDGELLAHAGPASGALRRELGIALAQLDRALLTTPPPSRPPTWWDLQHAARIGEHLQAIEPPALREQVRRAHHHFVTTLAARLAPLRRGVIHGDANDHNVLVRREAGGALRFAGLIDFGDLCHSALVGEVAIAATYLAMAADDPLQAIDDVVAGYDDELPLTCAELALVVPLIVTRCAVSITNATLRHHQRPDDAYTQVSQQGARRLLALLLDRCPVLAMHRLQLACGRPSAALPLPTNVATTLPFALAGAPQLDLGFASTTAGDDPLTFDADLAAARIARAIGTAPVAIGRYLEPRPLYTGPAFGADAPTAPRRTVHLGVDLFAPAGTPVAAAVAGTVHHVATCADPLDYGGLVVLRHERPDGTAFGSLYGHLDPASLTALRAGQPIAAGERFAQLGERAVNGGWPPHLHLQLLAHDPRDLPAVPPGAADPDDLPAHQVLYPDPAPW
ncbi:MAG: phosphotransferase, partial [Planctomycetes bacterium]|nr:phosphotransferase [Planctomycetota bacterium]